MRAAVLRDIFFYVQNAMTQELCWSCVVIPKGKRSRKFLRELSRASYVSPNYECVFTRIVTCSRRRKQ